LLGYSCEAYTIWRKFIWLLCQRGMALWTTSLILPLMTSTVKTMPFLSLLACQSWTLYPIRRNRLCVRIRRMHACNYLRWTMGMCKRWKHDIRTEGKVLVSYLPQSKLVTFSYLISREFFSRNFWGHPQIRHELVVKSWI
jgi:hypothetical protein